MNDLQTIDHILDELDRETAALCKAIQYPPGMVLKLALWVTSWFEEKDVQRIIEKLQAIEEQNFTPQRTASPSG